MEDYKINILKAKINRQHKVLSKLSEENKQLKERNNEAIEKLTLLIVIGFDYDGFNKIESLKSLIDELVGYAIESRKILKGEKNE